MVLGDQIRLYYTPPTPPEPEQIIIDTVEHGKRTALELSVGVWTNGSDAFGDYIWSAFRQTYWGDTTFKNWDYAPDGATGEPAIATFALSQIDLMREQILSAGNSSVQITDTTIEPYGWLCQNRREEQYGSNNGRFSFEDIPERHIQQLD